MTYIYRTINRIADTFDLLNFVEKKVGGNVTIKIKKSITYSVLDTTIAPIVTPIDEQLKESGRSHESVVQ